ncbi:MAG TPA: hypothetical protein VF525_04050 [Pyrinomonadaceae bacterium]
MKRFTSHSKRASGQHPSRKLYRFARRASYAALVALIAFTYSYLPSLTKPAHAQAPAINNPPVLPHSILVFPQRDFVSASGFAAADTVIVKVVHPNGTTLSSDARVPQDDPTTPDFDGIVEINHPGGGCWVGTTPDIRPGDRVQTWATNGATGVTVIDETTVQNVVAKRPVIVQHATGGLSNGIIQIHGTATGLNANGTANTTPLPITELEQRLVAPRDAFDVNGRRTLRAAGGVAPAKPGDGTLNYDPIDATNPNGINWTATYSSLDEADVLRADGAEARIMWLGAGAAGAEGTIYEIGAGILAGPSAPCTAPLEVLPPPPGSELIPPSTPTNLTATVNGSNTVHLTWTAATDNVGVTSYGIYRNGVPIDNVSNADGSAPAPTVYDDFNVAPGVYTYTVDAADAVGNRSNQSNATNAATTSQSAGNFPVCGTPIVEPCISELPADPVQIIGFPARDFTSASGYQPDDQVTVQVIRDGLVISTSSVIPVDDPTTANFDGIVEVNHPGGGCWQGVTPDIRTGDIIRQIAYAPVTVNGSTSLAIRRIDQTPVANISVKRPVIVHAATPGLNDGVIEIHGTAMTPSGDPMPLGNIEQRLVALRDSFDFNGRRTLRAGGGSTDGTFIYDAVNNADGIKFTVTYSRLNENDVFRAVGGTTSTGRTFPGAESRILWLGDPAAVAPGMTIYENSADTISGPAAGACFAPLEQLDINPPTVPTLTAVRVGANSVQLNWSAALDDVYVNGYGVYRDGVRIRNVNGSTLSYLDQNVPAGNHTYAVDAVDSASPNIYYTSPQNNPNASPTPSPTPTPNTPDPIIQGLEWGNRSALSNVVSNPQPDVLAPSTPANLVATANSATSSVTLTWTAATDNVGVASYRLYRNGVALTPDVTGTPPATTFTDAALAPGTYTYTVDAADSSGNRSAQSAAATAIVTAVADTIAPTTPTNLVANTRDIYTSAVAPAIGPQDILLTWTAATDNVGVTSYGIYRRVSASAAAPAGAFTKIADLGAGVLTYTDVSIAPGTYDYAVDAADTAGNRSAQSALGSAASVSDAPVAPHSIIPFPQRDFVSSTGYAVSEGPVVVSVIRGGRVLSTSTPVPVVEDPATPGFGAVEVNHPGGGCWNVLTPDLRPGDIVRFTNAHGVPDQTTTANVTAFRATDKKLDDTALPAGTVQTHGTAQDAAGNPLALDAVESRLIASSANPFSVNGRRTLRAGGGSTDGTLAYDPVDPVTNPKGTNWTATFTGLSSADVTLAIASESRGVWLGRDPLALTELTIFENGDGVVGGPSAPCTAPAEAGPAATLNPTSVDFGNLSAPTSGAAIASDTRLITVTNTGAADPFGSATLNITGLRVLGSSDFSIAAENCNARAFAANGSCTVSVKFAPTAQAARAGQLVIYDNANNSPFQIVPLAGNGIVSNTISVTAPDHSFDIPAVIGFVRNAQGSIIDTTARVELIWTGTGAISKYELQYTNNGGTTWLPVSLASPTATRAVIDLSMGTFAAPKNYRFRVRAYDANNAAGSFVTGAQFGLSSADDGLSNTVTYQGSWQTATLAGAFGTGSTVHFSTSNGARVNLNKVTYVNASYVAFVTTLGPDRGLASVSIDGAAPVTIDLYSATLKTAQVVVERNITPGQHTVTITVLGQRSPACVGTSCGTRVDIDSFLLLR